VNFFAKWRFFGTIQYGGFTTLSWDFCVSVAKRRNKWLTPKLNKRPSWATFAGVQRSKKSY
jgi:hypothetical protein